jgi:amphi-Trp domain-containing protein
MGRETILFKSEEKKDLQGACAFLRELTDRIEQGKVILRQGGNEVVLEIPATVELEVKAEKEEGRGRTKKKLEIEIEWVVDGEEAPGGGDRSVTLG